MVLTADSLTEEPTAEERFQAEIRELQAQLAREKYRPTDILYLGFTQLAELLQGDKGEHVQKALEEAWLVFIDDVHPRGDHHLVEVVSKIVERRYELGRHGTIITTNLDIDQLGGDDPQISRRLQSRFAEMFYTVDFRGCIDWRTAVKSRRAANIKSRLRWALRLESDPDVTENHVAVVAPNMPVVKATPLILLLDATRESDRA